MAGHSSEAGILGEPSYVWRSGQNRRLTLIRRYVALEDRSILDIGCGVGTYVRQLAAFSEKVYGVDVSAARLKHPGQQALNLLAAAGEHLPFADATFDCALLNEVIEHVDNDRETLSEATRVLRAGGHLVIYAPNRLYPFETHGIYLGNRYHFGNVPLVNYLPDPIRNYLVPHARAYRWRDIRVLLTGLPLTVVVHEYVYPGFDNIAGRSAFAASALRAILYRAEHTAARRFGLSHFLVLQKL